MVDNASDIEMVAYLTEPERANAEGPYDMEKLKL